MGVLATASLLALVILTAECINDETAPPITQPIINYLPLQFYNPPKNVEDNTAHSAQVAHQYESPLIYDYTAPKMIRFEPSDGIPNTHPLESSYHSNNFNTQHQQNHDSTEDGYPYAETGYKNTGEDNGVGDLEGYTHYKTSKNTNREGPYQVETIETKSYHKKVPHFDTSNFQEVPYASKKHGEVHYHQHEHVHEHEHTQDHYHQHKQNHKHSHDEKHKHGHQHKQAHKHSHQENHKHAHDHNQKHSHEHKAQHQHGHQHKQEHKHNHVENHKHGHDHKHQQDHKHDHHHGHKHEEGHSHGHDHGHQHSHQNSHKHGHDHSHKHDEHHGHKHGHKHGHTHGHKHGHNHGHKHEHHSKH